MSNLTAENAMYGHTSEDTAFLVDDYPYGFRLRTQIRYWIETTKRGDRFCSQTLNPKTGRWNKPKKSTYCDVMVMFTEPETGHISHTAVSTYSDVEWLETFRSITEGHLSDAQKKSLAYLFAARKVMENVKFTVREGSLSEEEKAEQERTAAQIGRAINVEANKTYRDLA